MNSKRGTENVALIHWGRFILAFLALLVAATHLASAIPSGAGSAPTHVSTNSTSNTAAASTSRPTSSGLLGFAALGLWIDIEVIAYTIIAIIFLMGLRTWYVPVVAFNAFNVILYFLSSLIAIPGITTMAFGSRFGALGISLVATVLVISWIGSLILGLVMLKYDRGSELDRLLVTHKGMSQ